ncbi:unnamed protein product [Somion occarium]|uniref:Uncharacterized protein n=1 Tax=Somion occarium TaxID=3059160 RepID=A0ABP1DWF4_9APHY
MSTWRTNPRYPVPTPASLRAPIYNPYDKFTATQFNAWIGDLTSQLKRALGREEPPPATEHAEEQPAPGDVSTYEDGAAEDSFAEVKARRAAKGKERAQDYEEEVSEVSGEDYGSEEEEYEEEQQQQQRLGWSEARWDHANGDGPGPYDQDAGSEEEGSDIMEETGVHEAEVIEILSDEEEPEPRAPVRPVPQGLENEDEGEGEGYDEEYEEDELRSSPPRPPIDQDLGYRIQRGEVEDEYEEDEVEGEVEDLEPPQGKPGEGEVEIPDAWQGPSTYAEDFYSGGDLPPNASQVGSIHLLPTEADAVDLEEEIEGPDEENEEFSPRQPRDVEIPDAWDGPRTYAEDFYAGGELRDDPSKLTPFHLTPQVLTPLREEETVTPAGTESHEHEVIDVDEEEVEADAEITQVSRRARSGSPIHEEDFDASALDNIYAQLDEDEEAEVGYAEVAETEDVLEKSATSFMRGSASSPNRSRMASRSGHLKTPEDEQQREEQEILEISDDDEEDNDVGPIPLGTSDLDIHHDHVDMPSDDSYVDPNDVLDAASAKLQDDGKINQEPLPVSPDVATGEQLPPHHDDASAPPMDEAAIYAELEEMYTMHDEFVDVENRGVAEASFDADTSMNVGFAEAQAESGVVDDSLPDQADVLGFLASFTNATNAPEVVVAAEDVQELPGPDTRSLEEQIELATDEILHAESEFVEQLRSQAEAPGPAPEEFQAQLNYVVTEVLSENDRLDNIPDVVSFDIMTDAGGDMLPVPWDFTVEEPMTEGRRTEEPSSIASSYETSPVPVEESIQVESSAEVSLETQEQESEAMNLVEEVLAPDVTTQETEDENEVHGMFFMPEFIPEQGAPYVVMEMEEQQIVDEIVAAIDVVTDVGTRPITPTDFSVEEAVTEGRRTEEPDFIVTSLTPSPGPVQPDIISSVATEPLDAESAIRDITSHSSGLKYVVADAESEDERPRRRRYRFVHTPSPSREDLAKARASSLSARGSIASLDVNAAADAGQASVEANETHGKLELESATTGIPAVTVSSEQIEEKGPPDEHLKPSSASPHEELHLLESGIPMPVSADPAVPDPISEVGTPSPASPSSDFNGGQPDYAGSSGASLRERLAATLIKRNTGRSPSGLFTPLTEGDASPASSELQQDVQIDNDATAPQEIPLESQVQDSAQDKTDVVAEDTDQGVLDAGTKSMHVEDFQDDESIASSRPDDTRDVHHDDVDADGDVDPDYIERSHELTSVDLSPLPNQDIGQDSFEVSGTEGQVVAETAEGNTRDDEGPSAENELAYPESDVEQDATIVDQLTRVDDTESVASTEQATKEPEEHGDAVSESSRPLKRKRRSPPAGPPRLTRSMSTRGKDEEIKSVTSKGKGRASEMPDDGASVTSSIADDSSEFRMGPSTKGFARSRGTSRASSVASSLQDTVSVPSQPSPTTDRATSTLPLPFIHTNGVLHHQHGRPPSLLKLQPVQRPQPPPPSHPSPSPPSQPQPLHEKPETLPTAPTAGASNALVVPTPSDIVIPSSSPVTRSNCRFHKISLPREEKGPRIFFVVPGCSLSNAELMEEEQIVDHGIAVVENVNTLVRGVEGLGFNSYLIGALRQLVGVDLLREEEIFYLPQPGEHYRQTRKPKRKHRVSIDGRALPTSGLSGSAVHRLAGSSHSPMKVPPSQAESISTVASSRAFGSQKSGKRSASRSASGSTKALSDNEEAPPPKRKRGRPKKVDKAAEEPSQLSAVASASASVESRPKVRRSRRLGADAAAYKPNENERESSEEDGPAKRKKGKRGAAAKGTKRSRTVETTGEDGDRPAAETKRRRVRGSST